MRNIIRVLQHELLRNLKRKSYLFTTFGLPLLAFGVIFAVQQLSGDSLSPESQMTQLVQDVEGLQTVGYVDDTGLFDASLLGEDLPLTFVRFEDVEKADTALDDEQIDVYYHIPADYLETGDFTEILPRLSISRIHSTPMRLIFVSYLIEQGVDDADILLLSNTPNTQKTEFETASLDDEGVSPETNQILVNVFAIILVMSVLTTNGYLMQGLIEEKETRLIEILISSVRPFQLLIGKIVAMGILGLIQITAYIVIVVFISQMTTGNLNLLGWAIGNGEEYTPENWEHQDYVEAQALYNVLEQDIVPKFYDHGQDGLPREWIQMVKTSMKKLAPFFNTHRMVQEYTTNYYMPTADLVDRTGSVSDDTAVGFAKWRVDLEKLWKNVSVVDVQVGEKSVTIGSKIEVTAKVNLGNLTPDDVQVQLYYGALNTRGEIKYDESATEDMSSTGDPEKGIYTFTGTITYTSTGDRGLSVRVLPKHDLLPTSFQPNLITWA